MMPSETYNAAIAKFGTEAQTRKAVEELTELSLALQRALDGRGDRFNICEEIADCRIMLDQLEIMYNQQNDVACWTIAKLNRLEKLVAS